MLSLHESDRAEFLFLQKHLVLFTNEQFGIYKKFKTIENLNLKDQTDIANGIMPIREKMYDEKNLEAFCKANKKLNDQQIAIVQSWRLVYSDDFFIIKHLKDQTVLMPKKEDKLYGVVGISGGLDQFFPSECLPLLINTKLLPFKEKIVYDGFFGYHNIHFGGNITRNLLSVYNKIKGAQGIISQPDPSTSLENLTICKSEAELIQYYVKQSLKDRSFPQKAWQLAKKNENNRVVFEYEYAKYFSKYQKSSLAEHNEIKPMHYAMYRDCIIGVAETKKSLIEFCQKYYPEITRYVYIFKT